MVFVIPVIVGTFYVFGRLQRKYTIQMQEAVAGANQVCCFYLMLIFVNYFMLIIDPEA